MITPLWDPSFTTLLVPCTFSFPSAFPRGSSSVVFPLVVHLPTSLLYSEDPDLTLVSSLLCLYLVFWELEPVSWLKILTIHYWLLNAYLQPRFYMCNCWQKNRLWYKIKNVYLTKGGMVVLGIYLRSNLTVPQREHRKATGPKWSHLKLKCSFSFPGM